MWMYVVYHVLAVSALIGRIASQSYMEDEPDHCCSPDRWTTHVKHLHGHNKGKLAEREHTGRLAYDWPGRRWAIEEIQPDNSTANIRLVYDHKQGRKYMIKPEQRFCEYSINEVEMFKHCVFDNMTWHGSHRMGLGKRSLLTDVFSYDFGMFPLRGNVRVTRSHCLPIQESMVGVVANTWRHAHGEPPCVPWKSPRRMRTGDCYKSHKELYTDRHTTQPTGPIMNALFVNMKQEVVTDMFDVPQKCTKVDRWEMKHKLSKFIRFYQFRFKEA